MQVENSSPAVASESSQPAAVNMGNEGGEAAPEIVVPDGEAPVEEAPVEETPKEPEQTEEQKREQEDFARRFAALTRREREFLARENRVKEKEQSLGSAEQIKAKIKESPLEALKEAGWSFKDLADLVLNDGKLPAEKQQKNSVDELKAEIEALKNQLNGDKEAEQQKAVEKQIATFRENIKNEVSSNLDKYELINVNEAFDMVYDVIESHFEQTIDPETGQGKILDIAEAADAVEKHLEEQAGRFFSAKKFASRLRPQDEEKPQETNGAEKAKIPPSPTLTHRQTTSAAPPTQGDHYMSDEESKRAAAEYLQKALAGNA